ncbi:MAG: diguanylate cyclase [Calditerrivibrio sp.]|nr:diguanylate cyclase [Calditerrivibrio sp.]
MDKRPFYHKLDWGWRGFKLSIGNKTIISFFLILIIPITGIYFALTNSIKNFSTNEYIDQVGNQVKSVYEILEKELITPSHIGSFIVKSPSFQELIKNNSLDLPNRLKLISDTINGINISFIYDTQTGTSITSNKKELIFSKIFFKSAHIILTSNIPMNGFEIIPNDQSIFSQQEIANLGIVGDDKLIVYLSTIPFKIGDKKYIFGSFTVLNNNRSIMDKLYNTFSYNTALFSAISLKEKIITTNSTPKNIFFLNLNLPNEITEQLSKHALIKGIYEIDHEPTAIAAVPLRSINGEIVGGLSIATNLKKLKIIISEFTAITTAIIFFSSIAILIIGAVVYNDTKRPIWGIKKAMEEVSEHNLDVKLDYRTFDDFEDIANYFNKMVQNIRQYTTTLSRFNQLNQIITTTLDVDEVLSISTNKILEYTNSQIAVVYLYNKDEDILKPYYVKNANQKYLRNVHLGEGIVGEVAKNQTYFCISEITPENFIIDSGLVDIKPKEIAAFPIAIKQNLLGVMVIGSTIAHKKEELDLINNLLTQVAIVLDNCLTHSHISELSIKDELTKVYNRRYLIQTLDLEISKSKRNKIPLSIGIFDIDNFKRINDTYGHPTGDLVLKKFAEIVQSKKRDYDIFGRFGGEEFLIILPNITHNELYNILERFRISIEEELIKYVNFKVTCSIGGASITDYEKVDIDILIAKADQNLYAAKVSGKNKVLV